MSSDVPCIHANMLTLHRRAPTSVGTRPLYTRRGGMFSAIFSYIMVPHFFADISKRPSNTGNAAAWMGRACRKPPLRALRGRRRAASRWGLQARDAVGPDVHVCARTTDHSKYQQGFKRSVMLLCSARMMAMIEKVCFHSCARLQNTNMECPYFIRDICSASM